MEDKLMFKPKEPIAVDIYEGEYPVDIANLPAELVIFRASAQFANHSRREDAKVDEYNRLCLENGKKRGIYHFLRPNGIAEQAQLFLNVWNRLGGTELRPVVDVEIDVDNEGIGRSTWASQIKTFLDLVEAETGKSPIIYTSVYFWEFTNSPSWASNYDVWAAWYPNTPDNYTTIPANMVPKGFRNCVLWQYAENGRSNGYLANDYNWMSPELVSELETVSKYISYNGGVAEAVGRIYDTDYKTILIPSQAIQNVSFLADGNCHTIDEVSGDFVFNWTPSAVGACIPNMGVKVDGTELYQFDGTNPFIAWEASNMAYVSHSKTVWNGAITASQGYRYIIKGGVKGTTSSAWDNLEPRRLVGGFANGDTVVISTQGRSASQRGWTLHEAAEYGLSIGLDFLIDGDSGKSVGDITNYGDGTSNWFSGTGANEPLPVIAIVNFKEPLITAPVSPTDMIIEVLRGEKKREWVQSDKYAPRKLYAGSTTFIPKWWANRDYVVVLPDQDTPDGIRSAAPAPAVWPVHGSAFKMDLAVQLFAADLLSFARFGVAFSRLTNTDTDYIIRAFTSLYASDRAFTNGTGFACAKFPTKRRNYIEGTNLEAELPRFDKIRVCSGDTLSGRWKSDAFYIDYFKSVPENYDITFLLNPRVFIATIIQKDGRLTNFPQLDGEPVPVPLMSRYPLTIPFTHIVRA